MPILNEATWQYIRTHAEDDVRKLALHPSADKSVDMAAALQQIEGRQKAKDKLPELFVHDGIIYPPTLSLEQCSSSVTAQYKASILDNAEACIADLSGGFGVDTFAFAEKFKLCHYVEPQNLLCALARHNASVLGLPNIEIHQGTMEEQLPLLPTMDYIYLDPSRRDTHGNRVVSIEDCTPNVVLWKEQLLQKAQKALVIKLSPMIDLKRTIQQLPEVTGIHVVAVHGECKEVLFLLSSEGAFVQDIPITAVNLLNDKAVSFQFSTQEENDACPVLANELGRHLYEPNAAILKAGAFKSIAVKFGIRKLHPHSHLYTSDTLVENFPGRVFTIREVLPFNRKNLRKNLTLQQANVSTRNFPISSEELKKSIRIKDGGDTYIFGTTLSGEKKTLIICEKAD